MFYYFILTFCFGVLFYGIGHLLNLFWKNKKDYSDYEKFFLKTVSGLITVIVIYAAVKTNGNTSLLGIFLLLLTYLYLNKDRISPFYISNLLRVEIKSLFLYLIVSFIFSALLYYLIFPDLISINQDFSYYATIADYLNKYGIESNALNILEHTTKPNFYHYSNEWATAFISWSSNNNLGITSFLYIYFPLIISILFIGLLCIVQRFSKKNIFIDCLISFSFFILCPIAGGGGTPSLFSLGGIHVTIGSYFSTPEIKLAIVILLLVFTLISYTREKFIDVIYLYLIIAYVWPVTSVAVFGGVFLFIVYKKVNENAFLKKEFILWLIAIIYIGFFYLFQKSDVQLKQQVNSSYLDILFDYIKRDVNIWKSIKYFFGTIIVRIYYYIIFILMIIINWNLLKTYFKSFKKYSQYFILYGLIALCGLIGKSILFFITDSNQLFENIVDNTFILIAIFILFLMVSKKKINYIFIVFFLLTSIITQYKQLNCSKKEAIDISILNTLKDEFSNKNYTFASSVNTENSSYNHIVQSVYPPLSFMRSFSNCYFPVNISLYDRYKTQYTNEKDYSKKLRFQSVMKYSPFYYFVEINKYSGTDWKVKYLFLKENKIDYLVFEKGSVSPEFISWLNILKRIDVSVKNVEIIKLKWD